VGSSSKRQTKKQELERYREAAELALEQLDWCISYLDRIRRPRIAQALRQNRKTIARRHQL
jgi:hypothetical protein